MGMHDAAASQHQGADSCLLATRRRECLLTPLSRNNSARHNTNTNTTTTSATTSSGLLRSMNRGRQRSGDHEPATFSLAGEKMMSAEEYGALPRSIQYVTCFLFHFTLRLERPAHRCHVQMLCLLSSLSCLSRVLAG
jgi:hypothetical protein